MGLQPGDGLYQYAQQIHQAAADRRRTSPKHSPHNPTISIDPRHNGHGLDTKEPRRRSTPARVFLFIAASTYCLVRRQTDSAEATRYPPPQGPKRPRTGKYHWPVSYLDMSSSLRGAPPRHVRSSRRKTRTINMQCRSQISELHGCRNLAPAGRRIAPRDTTPAAPIV